VTAVVAADQLPDDDTICALFGRLAAELGMTLRRRRNGRICLVWPDGVRVAAWRDGYPYGRRLARKDYEPAKRLLQIELLKLQREIKATGGRVLILFEGRDAAGKGGTIRRFTEHLNPRGARVVALDKPAEHEQGDNYLRRYLPHLPGPGEIVMFDRSWYNRAGVEQVMGFCPAEEYARFLADAPDFERRLVADGVTVVKLWFSITRAEQLARFVRRHDDPVKRWKLSPIDLASLDKWHEYTRAKEAMFRHTDIPEAPWTIIKSNDKKRARLAAMRHVLSLFDYPGKDEQVAGRVDALIAGPAALLPELADGPFEPTLVRLPGRRTASASAAGLEPAAAAEVAAAAEAGAAAVAGQIAADRTGTGRAASRAAATRRAGDGATATRRAPAKRTAAERAAAKRSVAERSGAERSRAERAGAARSGAARSGAGRTAAGLAAGPRASSAVADPAYLVQGDSGGDTGIERLGPGDRDPHDHVTLLRNEPGQSLAF
jgi:polyphosphate kinase